MYVCIYIVAESVNHGAAKIYTVTLKVVGVAVE
jgi:hypothetical protein